MELTNGKQTLVLDLIATVLVCGAVAAVMLTWVAGLSQSAGKKWYFLKFVLLFEQTARICWCSIAPLPNSQSILAKQASTPRWAFRFYQ
jgi:hypothetical protein